jgi:phosphohistidine phosphatase
LAKPGQDDHERPLNKRGRKSAKALGRWMAEEGISPELILCSDAARTQETFERLQLDGMLRLRPDLYLAEADRILQVLQQADGASVMIIGHNPGIGEFAQRLVSTPPPHARFADYPTGATLVVDVPLVDWTAGHFGTSRVVNFITPRELIGKDTDS